MATTTSQFETKVWDYVKSRHSVADDDNLRNAVAQAPAGTDLSVSGLDFADGDGRPCRPSARFVKTDDDAWTVKEHWFHKKDSIITDKLVAHDLTWMLRLRSPHVVCDRAA